jgi:hypothetical protein
MGFFTRSHSRSRSSLKESKTDDLPAGYTKPRPTLLRIFTSTCYLLSTIFLILVEIGNINNNVVIRDTFFLRISLANIIPASVPNALFINSIARSIGLHDFYQVGLWNFCEGYDNTGITYCSPTKTLYWFNPVEIILNELLAGASITLPTDIIDVLNLVRLASHWMFACFLVGTVLTFLCIFLCPLGFSKKPRWQHKRKRIFFRQFPLSLLTFAALLFTAAGSVIATVMFVIFRNQFSGAADLNIRAELGTPMLAFMWTAVGFNMLGFVMQIGTCCGVCCCNGRRKAERRSKLFLQDGARQGETREKTTIDGPGSPSNGSPVPGRFGTRFRRR